MIDKHHMAINSMRLSDKRICQWTRLSSVHIMACHLLGTKSLSEPMTTWFIDFGVMWQHEPMLTQIPVVIWDHKATMRVCGHDAWTLPLKLQLQSGCGLMLMFRHLHTTKHSHLSKLTICWWNSETSEKWLYRVNCVHWNTRCLFILYYVH